MDNAIGAFIGKYFSVIYIQNSLTYNQYLFKSLSIKIGNFHIFLFGEDFLENQIKDVVFVMTLELYTHKHCKFEAPKQLHLSVYLVDALF